MTTHPTDAAPYYRLDPDTVLGAVESIGLRTDGRLLALNSYENRVYQIGLEENDPVVAKFYRPGRWSDEQILEEHAFTLELESAEIPVVPPLVIDGRTLFDDAGFRFALFRRQGGHAPELEDRDTLLQLGRCIGRIHAVGAARPFRQRPELTPDDFGRASIATLLDGHWVPPHLETAFASLARDLMIHVDAAWSRAGRFRALRLHGDLHPGNLLWRDGPFFVDLDDSRSGPAIQDLWMRLAGERAERTAQLARVVEGYAQFHDFDARELHLIEALRTLRMLHHAAWIARRWADPAFPAAFPWFDDGRYWDDLVLGLREQLSALQEAPLELFT
ncbi:MAG: serine/threonine protein kinase [Xanthomonadales bacterium]